MLAVEQLEGNSFVVGTVSFGEAQTDFNVASVGYSRVFSADLQIDVVGLTFFDFVFVYVNFTVAAYFVQHRVLCFGSYVVDNQHHLASFAFRERAVACFVFEVHCGQVGIVYERRLRAAFYPQSAVAEHAGACSVHTREYVISVIGNFVRRYVFLHLSVDQLVDYLSRADVGKSKYVAFTVVFVHHTGLKSKFQCV